VETVLARRVLAVVYRETAQRTIKNLKLFTPAAAQAPLGLTGIVRRLGNSSTGLILEYGKQGPAGKVQEDPGKAG
jgi:hypothetical protein